MTITLDQVRASARKIVDRQGADFAYAPENATVVGSARCAYVRSSDPRFPYPGETAASGARITGCLVGEILTDLGLMTDRIARSSTGIEGLVLAGQFESVAVVYLSVLQGRQDRGRTWGEALAEAEAL